MCSDICILFCIYSELEVAVLLANMGHRIDGKGVFVRSPVPHHQASTVATQISPCVPNQKRVPFSGRHHGLPLVMQSSPPLGTAQPRPAKSTNNHHLGLPSVMQSSPPFGTARTAQSLPAKSTRNHKEVLLLDHHFDLSSVLQSSRPVGTARKVQPLSTKSTNNLKVVPFSGCHFGLPSVMQRSPPLGTARTAQPLPVKSTNNHKLPSTEISHQYPNAAIKKNVSLCEELLFDHPYAVGAIPLLSKASLSGILDRPSRILQSMDIQQTPLTHDFLKDFGNDVEMFSQCSEDSQPNDLQSKPEVKQSPLSSLSSRQTLEDSQPGSDSSHGWNDLESKHEVKLNSLTSLPSRQSLKPKSAFNKNGKRSRLHESYECEVCGLVCTTNSGLTQHMRTHTKVRPFMCKFCAKTFAQRSTMRTHVRLHTGEQPYKCEYCHLKFSDFSSYTKHSRTHTGEKPYVCKCGRGFSQSGNLHRHMKSCY